MAATVGGRGRGRAVYARGGRHTAVNPPCPRPRPSGGERPSLGGSGTSGAEWHEAKHPNDPLRLPRLEGSDVDRKVPAVTTSRPGGGNAAASPDDGESAKSSRSVLLETVPPSQSESSSATSKASIPARTAFRAALLLEVVRAGEEHIVAVGAIEIAVSAEKEPHVRVLVRALWRATHAQSVVGGNVHPEPPRQWVNVANHERLDAIIERAVTEHTAGGACGPEERATRIAKRLAEHFRENVGHLRVIRHGLERLFARKIRGGTKGLEDVLADLLELSSAASHARSEAREAAREGLWTWRTDPGAYNAQRRLADPNFFRLVDWRGRRSWIKTLSSGVRHCVEMERQLGEEVAVLQQLFSSASTIAVTRDRSGSGGFQPRSCSGQRPDRPPGPTFDSLWGR